jgi:hypothetical protein
MTTALPVRDPANANWPSSWIPYLFPASKIPRRRRADPLIGAEVEVDDGRVIGPIQAHIQREQDQDRLAGEKVVRSTCEIQDCRHCFGDRPGSGRRA